MLAVLIVGIDIITCLYSSKLLWQEPITNVERVVHSVT